MSHSSLHGFYSTCYTLTSQLLNEVKRQMSVRKREWTTGGEIRTAWVVDYFDQARKRRLKTFDRKREADAYAARAATEIAQGIHSAGSTTVVEAGELWLASRQAAGLERATLAPYGQHLRLHIAPLIGSMKLADLTVPALRIFEDRLRQEGRSPAMTRKVLVSLSGLLSDAQDRGLVAQNVARQRRRSKNGHDAARQKRKLEVGRDIPTVAEIRTLLPHLHGRSRPLLLLAIFAGLRASELRGVTWRDIDLTKGELTVRQRADRYAAIGPTKSVSGQRTVPLLPMVTNALREWKLASTATEADLVFPGKNGAPLMLTTIVLVDWHPVQIKAGLVAADGTPKYSGLHALRHFNASWCINRRQDGGLELPLKTVSVRLGHNSIQITADRYGHLFPTTNTAAEMVSAERAFMGC